MTHHFAMTSSLRIKIIKNDKFGVFSSDIDFETKMDIFRDDISLIINQCHLQATEGSLRRTRSVRQPRSATKRSALVLCKQHFLGCQNKKVFFHFFQRTLVMKQEKHLIIIDSCNGAMFEPSSDFKNMYATNINIENLLTQLQMMPDVVEQQTKIIRSAFIRLLP